ncbi:hypothetical protein VKT23_011921 [Stygiomarasmius scandens]|uniref:Uncharacterized protein n=1 Tax=Marasmiellus scandens TaxID=2682957 RepID=A0ABR1JAP7_9AGAR
MLPPTLPFSPSFHMPTFPSALCKTQPPPPTLPTKRHLRLKWTSLLIPILLIVITVSTRWISHPAVLDFVGVRQGHEHANESLPHIHKRHPAPQDNLISISFGSCSESGSSTAVLTTTTAAAFQGVPTPNYTTRITSFSSTLG